MLLTVWLFRVLIFLWIFGILYIIISKIIQQTMDEKLEWDIFFLFPILVWTRAGRRKIKESIHGNTKPKNHPTQKKGK